MAKILNHPRVYAFLHVPVQSASDSVLMDMKREYCVDDFKQVVDFLKERWDRFPACAACHSWPLARLQQTFLPILKELNEKKFVGRLKTQSAFTVAILI